MNSTRKPAQNRTQKANKNLITVKRSESQRQYEPTVSDPFEYSSGWEYEALHAGRFERRSPSPSLSPPPSRPIPSNMRPNDPKPTIFQPESKAQETAIWNTIEQLLAASSTSPPYADWSRACDEYFSDKTGKAAFPNPSPFLPKAAKCSDEKCVKGQWLGVCHHEMQKLFKGNGTFGLNWLRQERLRWHPDRFAAKMGRGKDQKEAREMAVEMFVLVQTLIDNYGKT
ncbi:hypothetical protein BKA64DRAFT_398121 [Cadophora sp. MPI-SDFR-AT-0126]|nr:hypothetical protein BKA64DRAFT_398121 [Leotiomycetes sp. MPI-SDFR-AT-0126]